MGGRVSVNNLQPLFLAKANLIIAIAHIGMDQIPSEYNNNKKNAIIPFSFPSLLVFLLFLGEQSLKLITEYP